MGDSQTLGEFRVRAAFNPSGDSKVDKIKKMAAELIDYINDNADAHGDRRAGAEAMTCIETGAMYAVKMVTTPIYSTPSSGVAADRAGGVNVAGQGAAGFTST